MELGILPLGIVEVGGRQRLERGALELLEALAARDAEARVASLVDAPDALDERLVDLGDRGEPVAAYSAEDDRLFRRNVTGDSAESAL
jgi:hypothetical protein